MNIFTVIQRFMAGTLSLGFFAHDFEFTLHIFGVSLFSGVYLMALLYFHFLVFLLKTGYVQLVTSQYRKYIISIRIVIAFFAAVYCFFDVTEVFNAGLWSKQFVLGLSMSALKLVLIMIPEIIFTIIFSLVQHGGTK